MHNIGSSKYKLVFGKSVTQPKSHEKQHHKMHGEINRKMRNYSLVSGKHSSNQTMPKTMFPIGTTNLKIYQRVNVEAT